MARIILLRHGKAEMPSIEYNDFERPLSARGTLNAAAIGKFCKSQTLPELVLHHLPGAPADLGPGQQEWQDHIPVRVVDLLYEASAQPFYRRYLITPGLPVGCGYWPQS